MSERKPAHGADHPDEADPLEIWRSRHRFLDQKMRQRDRRHDDDEDDNDDEDEDEVK